MAGGDYEVGYGRPPKASQFKSGQSGNPRGRRTPPPGEAAAGGGGDGGDAILRELRRLVEVRTGGATEQLPLFQALLRGLGAVAAGGR